MDLVLSLPASSAECERGFSVMKLIKTDARNRLSTSAMTDAMRIHLQSPSIKDFDPTEAIHAWNSSSHKMGRRRRPHYMSSKMTIINELQEDVQLNTPAGASQSAAATDDVSDVSDVDSVLESSDFSESDLELFVSENDD